MKIYLGIYICPLIDPILPHKESLGLDILKWYIKNYFVKLCWNHNKLIAVPMFFLYPEGMSNIKSSTHPIVAEYQIHR